ncbi:MAG: hypothetical protein KGS72_09850 [Cyanobacteria bacterium REEB67]|nr:hypothetical protein [Cyanobacteria bacterium REEB67]
MFHRQLLKMLLCLPLASGQAVFAPTVLEAAAAPDFADKFVSAVQSLGSANTESGITDEERFDLLASAPQLTVPLLAAQLRTLPRRTYFTTVKTPESRHVIACLRALHYISGHTFSARTQARLSDDERQFLDFDKTIGDSNAGHALHFFAVWMSRDAEIVAPLDVQKAIIEKWRAYAQEAAHRSLPKPAKPAAQAKDQWYWYG